MLARGDNDRLQAKTEEYLRVLEEEVRALRQAMNDGSSSQSVRKRLHRLVSHGSILKATSMLAAIEHMNGLVTNYPREVWDEAFENLEESVRELGVNLRRLVESYRSLE